MKKLLPFILIGLIAIGVIAYYIYSNNVSVDKEGGITTKKDALVAQEVSYQKDNMLFKFTKNRVMKTASIAIQYDFADKDEYTEFFGSKVTSVPFLINLLCGSLNDAFFDPENAKNKAKDSSESAKVTEDSDFQNALQGYKVTNFAIDFKDKETQEPIAKCTSNEKGFDHIKFTVSRVYPKDQSFFGQEIGGIPQDEKSTK